MKKRLILVFVFLFVFTLVGCGKKKPSDKQLIGFTIYEKSNTIGESQVFQKLNDIDINGVYTSDDYSFVSVKSDSLFDVKTDTSKLQGDLISPTSICLFITANYYQSQTVNYKLFLYEIYLLSDGTYSVELKTDIQLSSEVGDTNVANYSFESIKNDLNYVFTYKISFQKIAAPKNVIIKEFDESNQLINLSFVNIEENEYRASRECAYILVEEYTIFINENDEEDRTIEYTLITPKSQKKSLNFRLLNENNRVINFQLSFLFKEDIEEQESRSVKSK